MIITLKGADFSANKIGTLTTWSVFTTLGGGASYSGASLVNRGAAFSGTVTIAEGYELGSAGVTVMMGGEDVTSTAAAINGSTITISIAAVTGTLYISVPTVNTSTGEEDPTTTVWYQNATNDGTANLANDSGGTGPYHYHNNVNYVGKPINALRFKASKEGTLTYGTTNNTVSTTVGSITLTSADVGAFKIYRIPNLIVPSGEYIWFTGPFNYSQNKPDDTTLYFTSGNGGHINEMNLGIDVGYVV